MQKLEKRMAPLTYSKSTLSSLRFGVNWHFKATHGFDIINDSEFTEANKVFGAKCVDLKRQGLAKVEHKLPICEEGIKKLYESTAFGLNDPEKLQNKVFFFSSHAILLSQRKGKSSVNSRRLIFHSTRTAPEHATCANQWVNKQKTAGKMTKVSMEI